MKTEGIDRTAPLGDANRLCTCFVIALPQEQHCVGRGGQNLMAFSERGMPARRLRFRTEAFIGCHASKFRNAPDLPAIQVPTMVGDRDPGIEKPKDARKKIQKDRRIPGGVENHHGHIPNFFFYRKHICYR